MKKIVLQALSAILLIGGITLSVHAETAVPLPGDVNGDKEVTKEDSELLAKYFAGWTIAPEEICLPAGDMDGDGQTTRADAMKLARQTAGWNSHSDEETISEFTLRFIEEDTGNVLAVSDLFPDEDSTGHLSLFRTIIENDYPCDDEQLAAGSIPSPEDFRISGDRKIVFSDTEIRNEELYYFLFEVSDRRNSGYWLPEYLEFRFSDLRKDENGKVYLDIPLKPADKNLYVRFIDGNTEEVLDISTLYYYLQPMAYISVRYEDSARSGHIHSGFFGGAFVYDNKIITLLDDQNMLIENVPVLEEGNYFFDLYNTAVSPDTLYRIPQDDYMVPQEDLTVDQSGNGHIVIRLYPYR